MPFLRLSRDQRGYENTLLLHVAFPGARPRVLYWYRSAPAVRVGRRALDEDAIRVIEEQHPDIEFDWPSILEEANTLPPEVERRQERQRRKPSRPREPELPARPASNATPPALEPEPPLDAELDVETERPIDRAPEPQWEDRPPPASAPRNPLLDELVGREIAARLRSRFDDIQLRISRATVDEGIRASWQSRADTLNPDSWTTPAAILDGVQRVDLLVDELRHEISVTK